MYLFKGQLTLFKRGQGFEGPQLHYVMAAWHSRWSITWSWLVWWWPKPRLVPHARYSRYPNGNGTNITVSGPFGTFHFATQKTMRGKHGSN